MKNLKNIRVAFDNAGGAHLWTRGYAHSYSNAAVLAADIICLIAGGNINTWDGNDEELRDAMRKDPAGCNNYPGRNDVYTVAEIAHLLANSLIATDGDDVAVNDGRLNTRISGHTEAAFFRAVSAR